MRRLGLLLLAASLAGCAPAAPDPRGVARDEVLLQVSASGRSEARPDEARFTTGVETNGLTGPAASAAYNAAMGRVMAALTALCIAAQDVQTRSITLSRIDYGPERGRYRAGNMAEVRVRDLDKVGAAIAATTEAGGNVVSGPDLRVSSQEAADNSAYAAAFKAARARADAYAAAGGLRVARVLAIRDAAAEGGPIGYGAVGAAVEAQSSNAAPFRPGMNGREVRVRVDFALAK